MIGHWWLYGKNSLASLKKEIRSAKNRWSLRSLKFSQLLAARSKKNLAPTKKILVGGGGCIKDTNTESC